MDNYGDFTTRMQAFENLMDSRALIEAIAKKIIDELEFEVEYPNYYKILGVSTHIFPHNVEKIMEELKDRGMLDKLDKLKLEALIVLSSSEARFRYDNMVPYEWTHPITQYDIGNI